MSCLQQLSLSDKPVKSLNFVFISLMASPVEDIYQTAEFIQPTYLSWIGAVLGTVMVGLSGLVPMLIIPLDAGQNLRSEQGSRTLRLLLSFAVS